MFSFFCFSFAREVYEIDSKNATTFIHGKEPVVIKFYSPDCPYCQELAPQFNLAAKMFYNVKFAQINCVLNETLCESFNVFKYPHIQIRNNGKKAIDFTGEKKCDSIIDFIEENTGRVSTRKRPALRTITPYNFNKTINNSVFSLILFTTKDGEIFENSLYVTKDVAKAFKYQTNVTIGKVDCESYKVFCESQNIEKDPTMIEFFNNKRKEFSGVLNQNKIIEYINNKAKTHRKSDGLLDDNIGVIKEANSLVRKYLITAKTEDEKRKIVDEIRALKSSELYVHVIERIEKEGIKKIYEVADKMREVLEKMEKPGKVLDSIKLKYNIYSVFVAVASEKYPKIEL